MRSAMTPSGRRPEPRTQVELEVDRHRVDAVLGILGIAQLKGHKNSLTNARRRRLIQQLRQWRDFDVRTSIGKHFALDEYGDVKQK